MIKESSIAEATSGVSSGSDEDTKRGLSVSGAETKDEMEKALRSRREEDLVRNALSFMRSAETKWCDARGQSGPSPADFGDHEPIPVDAICASVVLSTNKES
ncbi:MAG TPA: hypothetical protein VMY18_11810 [Acidobacteriota bacterium]|nr:hypothetical protein [Acidobacteriota bacterium]